MEQGLRLRFAPKGVTYGDVEQMLDILTKCNAEQIKAVIRHCDDILRRIG